MPQNKSFQPYLGTFSDTSTRSNQISVTVLACTELEATRLCWQELSILLCTSVPELMRKYKIETLAIVETEKHYYWKVTLNHCINDALKSINVFAIDEDRAAKKALKTIKQIGLNPCNYDVWGCKKIAPGGSRPGAGRPPGRKTKPIRVPLENIEKVEKLDVVLDILREWKIRSSLNDKSARFYFLDQAIAELEEHWGKI